MVIKSGGRTIGYRLLARIDFMSESDRAMFETVLRSYRDVFEKCLRLYVEVSHRRFGSALKWVKFATYSLVKITGVLRHVPSSLLQQCLFLVWEVVQPYLVDEMTQEGKFVRRLSLDVDRFLMSSVLPLPYKYVSIDPTRRVVSLPHCSRTVWFDIRPFPEFSIMLDILDSLIYLNPIYIVRDENLGYYYIATPVIRDYDLFGDDAHFLEAGGMLHVIPDPSDCLLRGSRQSVLLDD